MDPGVTDVIHIHELLTNLILLFNLKLAVKSEGSIGTYPTLLLSCQFHVSNGTVGYGRSGDGQFPLHGFDGKLQGTYNVYKNVMIVNYVMPICKYNVLPYSAQ